MEVSGSTLQAGRDVVVVGRSVGALSTWLQRFGFRRLALGLAGISLAVFLVAYSWPPPPATAVDLNLESTYLRFRLAEEQEVLAPMSAHSLTALDLQEVRLPRAWAGAASPDESFPDGRLTRDAGTRRLDFRLEGLNAEEPLLSSVATSGEEAFTLQQGYLPAGSIVTIKLGDDDSLELSIDSLEEPLSLSTHGRFRYRPLVSGRKAPAWSEAQVGIAQRLELTPRLDHLDLVLGLDWQEDQELAPSMRIDRLWLYEVERTTDGASNHLQERYRIRSGKLAFGTSERSIDLGHGSELRLNGVTGHLAALRWSDGNLRFRFQGTVTELSRGPRQEAVNLLDYRISSRELVADVAALLTILNGLLSLLLSLPIFLKITRLRASRRRGPSTSKP